MDQRNKETKKQQQPLRRQIEAEEAARRSGRGLRARFRVALGRGPRKPPLHLPRPVAAEVRPREPLPGRLLGREVRVRVRVAGAAVLAARADGERGVLGGREPAFGREVVGEALAGRWRQ